MYICTPEPINLKPCLCQLQSAVKQAIEERGAIAMAETSETEQESIFEDLLGFNSEQCGSSSVSPSCLVMEPVAKVMRELLIYILHTHSFFSFPLTTTLHHGIQVMNYPPHSWEEKV